MAGGDCYLANYHGRLPQDVSLALDMPDEVAVRRFHFSTTTEAELHCLICIISEVCGQAAA